MDEPGELEILERQVSLLQTLLGNLERRRANRRTGASAPPAPCTEEPRARLRLVVPSPEPDPPAPEPAPPPVPDPSDPPCSAPLPDGGRKKPHFREKRRWDLSSPAVEEDPEPVPEDGAAGPDPGESAGEGAVASWKAFREILRERDDLLLQLAHHQAAEARLMEERAAGERKDEEIQRLQEELRSSETSGLHDLLAHLQARLQLTDRLEGRLVGLALEKSQGPAPAGREEAHCASARSMSVMVRGCQVELATAGQPVYAFAVVTRRQGDRIWRRGFHALGSDVREAELACLDRVLRYLDEPPSPSSDDGASREMLHIGARRVEVLCDRQEDGTYRAFPFLHEGGARTILLRFHVQEPITGPSATEASQTCKSRLEEYF
jgi:hypothetical protein